MIVAVTQTTIAIIAHIAHGIKSEFAEYSSENGGGEADTDGVCGAGWTSVGVGRLFAV